MTWFEKNYDVPFCWEADGGLRSSVSKPTDGTLPVLLPKIMPKIRMFYGIFKVKVAVPFPPSSSSTVTVTV